MGVVQLSLSLSEYNTMKTQGEQDMALYVLNLVVRFKFRPVQIYRKESSFPSIIHWTD
jgi:hypothetical protein